MCYAFNQFLTSVGRGSDFRPPFSKLGGLGAHTNVPFMALTVTSSEATQSMIVKSLYVKQPIIVSCNLDCPKIKSDQVLVCKVASYSIKLLYVFQICAQKELGGLAPKLSPNYPKTIYGVHKK